MMTLYRIIENQAALSSYKATKNEAEAVQLELLIEKTKPKNPYHEWHPLIATPFRYSPPHPSARFRPPYGKNVFYGASCDETALFEHAFHFMKQRLHLNFDTDTGLRTLFSLESNDDAAFDFMKFPLTTAALDKSDYRASHEFILNNPNLSFIRYPSVRDPHHRANAAVLDIKHLNKNPTTEHTIQFFYDNKHKIMLWLPYHLHIHWSDVA